MAENSCGCSAQDIALTGQVGIPSGLTEASGLLGRVGACLIKLEDRCQRKKGQLEERSHRGNGNSVVLRSNSSSDN